MERKKKDDDEVVRKAKEWKELNEERKKRRFEVNKKHQQDIIEQWVTLLHTHNISIKNKKYSN